jgi:uncharacterized membrane protein required for colicin V production
MGPLNILDIAIIVILLIFSIAGFSKGFLSSLLKLFSSVASLAIAVWLAKPVAVFIDGLTNLSNWFAEEIGAAIAGIDTFFTATVGVTPSTAWTPGGSIVGSDLKTAIDAGVTGLSDIFKTALNFLIQDDVVLESGTVISEWFGEILGGIAMLIVAAIVVYIAIRIAIGILSKIFDAITKNPAIGGLDRLLGLAFGAVKGALLIAIIFGVYSVVVVIPGVETATSSFLDNSLIGKEIYNIVSEFVVETIGQIDFNALIQGAFNSIGI